MGIAKPVLKDMNEENVAKVVLYSFLESNSPTLNAPIFVRTLFQHLFSSYMYVVKAAKMTFVRKICTFNVDEIDTWSQINQHLKIFVCQRNRKHKL